VSEEVVGVIGFVLMCAVAITSFFYMRSPEDAGKLIFGWLVMFGLMATSGGFQFAGSMVLFVIWFIAGLLDLAVSPN